MDTPDTNALLTAAREVAKNAYAPYSNFTVGAALLTDKGVITGCNVENASYGLTICAERNAITTAVAQGAKHILALALAAPKAVPPCGACLQVLAEFCGPELPITLAALDESVPATSITLGALFPTAFKLNP